MTYIDDRYDLDLFLAIPSTITKKFPNILFYHPSHSMECLGGKIILDHETHTSCRRESTESKTVTCYGCYVTDPNMYGSKVDRFRPDRQATWAFFTKHVIFGGRFLYEILRYRQKVYIFLYLECLNFIEMEKNFF